MFDSIQQHLVDLPFAIQLIAAMAGLAAFDFLFAVVANLKQGTFQFAMFGSWIGSKGLPILVVALLYGLDSSVKLMGINVGDTDLGAFGALAYAQGLTFVGQEVASILKNAKLFGADATGTAIE